MTGIVAGMKTWVVTAALATCACGGGGSAESLPAAPLATVQETQCVNLGWQRLVVDAAGAPRVVLWKAPAGGWTRGAIVVLHGGGGQHANFCIANVELTAPQVRFTALALAQGFAVFLPDSSDRVTDNNGRLCGKVWDDEVRARANLDLPFFQSLLATSLPQLRPPGSRSEIFFTGLSSGGYMTVRVSSRFADQVRAFAPISSGDPYGWTRDCTPRAGDRVNVFGVALDNETGRQIHESGACAAPAYPNERTWDGAALAARPPWKSFHHVEDGIHDLTCVDKLRTQLQARGYPELAPLRLQGGTRAAQYHYWLDDYNQPLLDFFSSRLR